MPEAGSEKRATYRSGEPLRRPKSCAKGSFSAASKATVPKPLLQADLSWSQAKS